MSKKSEIGIGLGVALGVLLLFVAMGAFIFYRRKRRQKDAQGVPVTNQPNDELAPLPIICYKEPHTTRLSQTETVASSFSKLSSDQRSEGTDRRLSELMSTERAELG
jgi:DNA-directed RNA polymerase specialized sigma24 family protein